MSNDEKEKLTAEYAYFDDADGGVMIVLEFNDGSVLRADASEIFIGEGEAGISWQEVFDILIDKINSAKA